MPGGYLKDKEADMGGRSEREEREKDREEREKDREEIEGNVQLKNREVMADREANAMLRSRSLAVWNQLVQKECKAEIGMYERYGKK